MNNSDLENTGEIMEKTPSQKRYGWPTFLSLAGTIGFLTAIFCPIFSTDDLLLSLSDINHWGVVFAYGIVLLLFVACGRRCFWALSIGSVLSLIVSVIVIFEMKYQWVRIVPEVELEWGVYVLGAAIIFLVFGSIVGIAYSDKEIYRY